MGYNLAISPCPNDTFIFYGMVCGLVGGVGGVDFLDIEGLNRRILGGGGGVIKGSVAVGVGAIERGYGVLEVGGALGRGNGPVVVGCGGGNRDGVVALPGENTTATLLFKRYFKDYKVIYAPFHQIGVMVSRGEVEIGVLIHEGRFTYRELGLELVGDLGEMWERECGLPLPLGLIYTHKDVDRGRVTEDILGSMEYAKNNRDVVVDYCRKYSQELSEDVLGSHIDCFVNEYSWGLGVEGRLAVNTLLGRDIF